MTIANSPTTHASHSTIGIEVRRIGRSKWLRRRDSSLVIEGGGVVDGRREEWSEVDWFGGGDDEGVEALLKRCSGSTAGCRGSGQRVRGSVAEEFSKIEGEVSCGGVRGGRWWCWREKMERRMNESGLSMEVGRSMRWRRGGSAARGGLEMEMAGRDLAGVVAGSSTRSSDRRLGGGRDLRGDGSELGTRWDLVAWSRGWLAGYGEMGSEERIFGEGKGDGVAALSREREEEGFVGGGSRRGLEVAGVMDGGEVELLWWRAMELSPSWKLVGLVRGQRRGWGGGARVSSARLGGIVDGQSWRGRDGSAGLDCWRLMVYCCIRGRRKLGEGGRGIGFVFEGGFGFV